MTQYPAKILEHFKNPKKKGKIDNYHVKVKEYNHAHCGDEVELFLKVEDGKIADIGHESDGCALCKASASILSDYAYGKDISILKELSEEDYFALTDTMPNDTRKHCILLALKTLKKALKKVK